MDDQQIRSLILEVRKKFPKALWTNVPEYIDKDVLHIRLAYVPKGRVIDLGGGYSPTSAVLARMGMEVTVVDTFASTKFYEHFSEAELRDVLGSFGVNVVKEDLLRYEPAASNSTDSVDSVVSHDTLYFFNPRGLLEKCMAVLKPGGTLAINLNSAVSLLRRVRVLFGKTNVDRFHSYFFDEVHKRYWTVDELRALAQHLRLAEVNILGRNWSLYQSRERLPKPALRFADRLLRPFPGLCNDIYLIGKK